MKQHSYTTHVMQCLKPSMTAILKQTAAETATALRRKSVTVTPQSTPSPKETLVKRTHR